MKRSYGRYSVTIADDGAIKVIKDDCISNYSFAIHSGDPSKTHEYGRLRAGKMLMLHKPFMIIEGETIYHIPTYVLKRLEKPERELKEAIEAAKGLELATEVMRVTHGGLKVAEGSLKTKLSAARMDIQRLEKKAAELRQIAGDAAETCSDMYSCIGGGLISEKNQWKARKLDEQVQELKKKVEADSRSLQDVDKSLQNVDKSLQDLNKYIRENRKQQEQVRDLIKTLKGMLSLP
jgi:chaperonin cofactor prefoldin